MGIIVQKPKKKYRGKRNEFYAVAIILYLCFNKLLSRFTAYKSNYNSAYFTARINELKAAAALPEFMVRNDVTESLREQLKVKAYECINKWKGLRGYIIDAFAENLQKSKLEAAGSMHYKKASELNWENLSSLMGKGLDFITNNLTALTANNNMPAAFQTEFSQLITETTAIYFQFQEATNTDKQSTYVKLEAENDSYKKLMKMLKDAQYIFRNEPGNREQFVYTTVLKSVSGASNGFAEFEVAKNSSIVIKKLVGNTPFVNTGNIDLVVCNGEVACTVASGITVPAGTTIIMEEGVTTITVLNTNTTLKGKCEVRVVKK